MRQGKPYLLGFLVFLMVAGAIWALIYVPKMQVPVCPPGKEGLPPKICFDIENEARRTLAYIMGGLLAIIGIILAFRRIRALERQVLVGQDQLKVVQEGQITERFTRAIEQLGSDKIEIRLGGIYALERIANDSDKDYWAIMETLTAYVRERAAWNKQPKILPLGENPSSPVAKAQIKPATDIQAVLIVLGRRKYGFGKGENEPLNLSKVDLRGINLSNMHLESVDFSKAHLEKAIVRDAHLENAYLFGAHLEEADLRDAHLEGANLINCHLEEAYLYDTQLQGADLSGAHIEEAILNGTKLKDTNLSLAHLEGVILRSATGLTQKQLAQAILNHKTQLPDYLLRESLDIKRPKGNDEK
jgi:hypothetical protein